MKYTWAFNDRFYMESRFMTMIQHCFQKFEFIVFGTLKYA